MKISDCGASKIISNDTKLEDISWELNIENPFLELLRGRFGSILGKSFCTNQKMRKKIPHFLNSETFIGHNFIMRFWLHQDLKTFQSSWRQILASFILIFQFKQDLINNQMYLKQLVNSIY